MDITYKTDDGIFNYRVCAVIINNGKLLAMHDERSPYYYLPGGRVKLHESAEKAIIREVNEELGVSAQIARPLWINQGFFTEDVNGKKYHELCIYFLMDISQTNLFDKEDKFRICENNHIHDFEWLKFERLKDEYIYPVFIKKQIFHLPDKLTLQTEFE